MTSLGEFHTPLVPGKKIDSYGLQPQGGLMKSQVLCHGNEVSDVTQFHGWALYIAASVPTYFILIV